VPLCVLQSVANFACGISSFRSALAAHFTALGVPLYYELVDDSGLHEPSHHKKDARMRRQAESTNQGSWTELMLY
jgi:hypothetical protein